MSGYEDLKIYEKSYKAAIAVRKLTRTFPEEEKYSMTDQMNRASISIPLNIAEGYAKQESKAEFNRFLSMALGSANEMEVLISFAKDFGYIGRDVYEKSKREYEEIGKMIRVFKQKIGN